MRIQPVTTSNQTTFGNIIATEKVLKYLNDYLSPKQIKEFNHMIIEQKGKKPDINLTVDTFMSGILNAYSEHEYLRANIGQKNWTDKWFLSAFGVIKKAVRYAEKFDGELEINPIVLNKN